MRNQIRSFGEIAKQLARNPLGIIALFIVLVYALASLVTIGAENLTSIERLPLIYFLILFPGVVLTTFVWLVIRHSEKLYGPSDFKDEENYMELQRRGVEARVLIHAATVEAKTQRAESDTDTREIVREFVREITDYIQVSNPAQTEHKATLREQVLWVDDHPENNIYVREAFNTMGVHITLARSTDEAFEKLSRGRYDTIISDMKRHEGPREGYVLLDGLREKGDHTPLFFYSSRVEPEHKRETLKHGGQGCTNDPEELFEMVMKAIGRS